MSNLNIQAGTIIDDFVRVDEVIGRGGMGLVYRATQVMLERPMALKVLDPEIVSDKQFRSRFKREAQALSRLTHRNIVGFYKFGFWQERIPYIAMELLEGSSLDHILARKEAMSAEKIKTIAIQVAEALSYVHENGIVHRDLKPSNIMLVDEPAGDTVKLLDFGLARIDPKSQPGADKLTRTGSLLGTVSYMSPEQSRGENIDLRTDIYSLGCIIYEMLSSNPPFEAENAIGIMLKHQNEPVPMIPSEILKKGLEYEQLACIAEKCLAKKAAHRYQSMKALLCDLRNLGGEIDAPALRSQTPASRTVKVLLASTAISVITFVIFVLACRTAIEAQYVRFLGGKDAWRLALKDAREMNAAKKKQEAVMLLLAALDSAKKNKADVFDLAKIKLELASILMDMNQRSESGIYASQAIMDLASVSQRKDDWVVLDAKGFAADVKRAAELLLQIKHKDTLITNAVSTLAKKFEEHQDYECLIVLSNLELQLAWQVARIKDALLALSKQTELANYYRDAKMYKEAKNEYWKNINKAIHLGWPHLVAQSLRNLTNMLNEKERKEELPQMLAAAAQVQKLFPEGGHPLIFRFYYYCDMGTFYSTCGDKAKAKEFLSKSEAILSKSGDRGSSFTEICQRQANAYRELGDRDKMLKFAKMGLAELRSWKSPPAGFPFDLYLAGIVYLRMSGYSREADSEFDKLIIESYSGEEPPDLGPFLSSACAKVKDAPGDLYFADRIIAIREREGKEADILAAKKTKYNMERSARGPDQ